MTHMARAGACHAHWGASGCCACTGALQPGSSEFQARLSGQGPVAPSKAGSTVRRSPPWPPSWLPSPHCGTHCCCTCAASRAWIECTLQWVSHSWCRLAFALPRTVASPAAIALGQSETPVLGAPHGITQQPTAVLFCTNLGGCTPRMNTRNEAPAVQLARLPRAKVCNDVPAVQHAYVCMTVRPLTMAHACPQGGPCCAACMC